MTKLSGGWRVFKGHPVFYFWSVSCFMMMRVITSLNQRIAGFRRLRLTIYLNGELHLYERTLSSSRTWVFIVVYLCHDRVGTRLLGKSLIGRVATSLLGGTTWAMVQGAQKIIPVHLQCIWRDLLWKSDLYKIHDRFGTSRDSLNSFQLFELHVVIGWLWKVL